MKVHCKKDQENKFEVSLYLWPEVYFDTERASIFFKKKSCKFKAQNINTDKLP